MNRFILLSLLTIAASPYVSAQSTLTFHDYQAVNINGDTVSLSQYYGKKVLVVNTASYCGYTPQFDDLEALYQQYHQYNFEILGFPCNNFGNQDPHSDSVILDFCTSNYDVTFPMMHKVDIITGDTAPVYKWLQRANLNGVQNAHVAWNFNKFLIDEAGHWVAHYLSPVNPLDTAITNWIMSPSVITSASNDATGNAFQLVRESNRSFNLYADGFSGELELNVYNMAGQLLNQATADGGIAHLDLSDAASGLYIVNVRCGQRNQSFGLPVF